MASARDLVLSDGEPEHKGVGHLLVGLPGKEETGGGGSLIPSDERDVAAFVLFISSGGIASPREEPEAVMRVQERRATDVRPVVFGFVIKEEEATQHGVGEPSM